MPQQQYIAIFLLPQIISVVGSLSFRSCTLFASGTKKTIYFGVYFGRKFGLWNRYITLESEIGNFYSYFSSYVKIAFDWQWHYSFFFFLDFLSSTSISRSRPILIKISDIIFSGSLKGSSSWPHLSLNYKNFLKALRNC